MTNWLPPPKKKNVSEWVTEEQICLSRSFDPKKGFIIATDPDLGLAGRSSIKGTKEFGQFLEEFCYFQSCKEDLSFDV